jgi:nitroreductase
MRSAVRHGRTQHLEMNLDQAVAGRRSIRKFRSTPVPRSVLVEIVDLARQAPSSMNGQPWHFLVVTRRHVKSRLAAIKNRYLPEDKRGYPADLLRHAPVVVVVCVDEAASHGRAIENGVLASALLLLAAHSRGLGAVYLSAYRAGQPRLASEIKRLLNAPRRLRPITMIPLGRPAEHPPAKELRQLQEILHFETFDGPPLRLR